MCLLPSLTTRYISSTLLLSSGNESTKPPITPRKTVLQDQTRQDRCLEIPGTYRCFIIPEFFADFFPWNVASLLWPCSDCIWLRIDTSKFKFPPGLFWKFHVYMHAVIGFAMPAIHMTKMLCMLFLQVCHLGVIHACQACQQRCTFYVAQGVSWVHMSSLVLLTCNIT